MNLFCVFSHDAQFSSQLDWCDSKIIKGCPVHAVAEGVASSVGASLGCTSHPSVLFPAPLLHRVIRGLNAAKV